LVACAGSLCMGRRGNGKSRGGSKNGAKLASHV